MSISKTNDYGIGDNNFTAFQNSLDTTRRGKSSIALSNYDNDSAPVVKVGSWFENNGALYEVVTSDESPTGYGGIAVSTEFYLYYDDSAGSFYYSATVPDWSDSKQGWYHPTNTNDRALFYMFKDSGGTLYQYKSLVENKSVLKAALYDYVTSSAATYVLPSIQVGQSAHVGIEATGGNTSFNLPPQGTYNYQTTNQTGGTIGITRGLGVSAGTTVTIRNSTNNFADVMYTRLT